MKRTMYVLLVSVSVLLPVHLSAQWTTSGSNIYSSNSGNVGIGKSNPGYKLDVSGTTQTTGLFISKPNTVTNWNNLWQSGFYEGYSTANSPESGGNWLWGIHMGHSSNSSTYRYGGQIAIKNNSTDPEMYFRATDKDGKGAWRKILYQDMEGKTGIGTTSPEAPLHVKSTTTINNYQVAAILGNDYNHWTYFGSNKGGRIRGGVEGYLVLDSNPNGIGDKRLYLNLGSSEDIVIGKGGGSVGIGTDSPGAKLDVTGDIRAHEIRVCLNQGCDFVFEPDYDLMPLEELDRFITDNKHLPEVAPAAVMESEGINLSEMNAKLLQKIEEQTLYIIELNKKMLVMGKEIEALKTAK